MTSDTIFGPVEESSARSVTIRRPDDWHLHLRDGDMMRAVLPFTTAQFARAIVMPNLVPPVTAVEAARAYRDRILAARPENSDFQPLMTCYLTDETRSDEVENGFREGVWAACKLYPAGATTNSSHGVTDFARIAPVLERMERIGMPVLVHGEVTDPEVDIFDRERVFIEKRLGTLLKSHPGLKIVLEHVTTEEGVAVVRENATRMAATITPHHLIINRTSLFQGGLRPHYYCLPVAKREHHRQAVRRAAASGEPCFFLGTDSAPHLREAKQAECCSAGIFCGATALQTYAQVFEEEGALDALEAFASLNGPRFYGLPLNEGTITLRRTEAALDRSVRVGESEVVMFRGGERLAWSIENDRNS
jgi:dihydroorotase